MPSQRRLNEIFKYNPITGYLENRKTGEKATSPGQHGYLVVEIPELKYPLKAHRVIYKLFHGIEPGEVIDHINMRKNDNSISNLESITVSENTARANRILNLKRAKSKNQTRLRAGTPDQKQKKGITQ